MPRVLNRSIDKHVRASPRRDPSATSNTPEGAYASGAPFDPDSRRAATVRRGTAHEVAPESRSLHALDIGTHV
jgi:hypothetical protein